MCVIHGGGAPQVQATAKERIAALVDPAIDALQRALHHRDIGAAVRAARDLLDRAGLAAPKPIELTERRRTLEEVIAGASSPEMKQLSRLERMSPQAVHAECEAHHGGACRTLPEHADRCAAAQAATDGPTGDGGQPHSTQSRARRQKSTEPPSLRA